MSRTKWIPWLALLVGGLWCAFSPLSISRAAEPLQLGRVFHESASARGVLQSAGSPVLAGDIVRSVSRPALLRLDNGNVLKFAANSSALVEANSPGIVKLTVLSGRVLTFDPNGRLQVAGRGSTFHRLPTYEDTGRMEERLLALDPSQESARREPD